MTRQGKRFMLAGVIVALTPIALAALAGGNMFDESSGGGAALWLLFFSIPIGFVLTVVGAVRWLFAKRS